MELTYRKTAAAGLDGLGLLIALYDTLAGDLRRAAEAERRNDIARRCREASHALVVIGNLEHWLERGSGGELAETLKGFYASLRKNIIAAQAKRSPAIFEEQMALVLKLRAEFQNMEDKGAASTEPHNLPPIATQQRNELFMAKRERSQLSWSA